METSGTASARPPIEIGWLLSGERTELERVVFDARRQALQALEEALPGFDWRMPILSRPLAQDGATISPVRLLEAGADEREAQHWDFVFVVTSRDLSSRERNFVLGVPSRTLNAAALSTARLAPPLEVEEDPETARTTVATRLARLALHQLGHLLGLAHEDDEGSLMARCADAAKLDAMAGFSDASRSEAERELSEAADARIEERPENRRLSPLAFYLRVAINNGDDVLRNVRQIAPWTFPVRFARLTIAAASTALVLMFTAESWELGMSQSLGSITGFAAASLLFGSAFVVHRQRLLRAASSRRLTEQGAVTRMSLVLAVLVGMAVTFALLFAVALALAMLLFPSALVASWAPSLEVAPTLAHLARFAAFVATVAMLIGALGASFEPENDFRQVAYVDEED